MKYDAWMRVKPRTSKRYSPTGLGNYIAKQRLQKKLDSKGIG